MELTQGATVYWTSISMDLDAHDHVVVHEGTVTTCGKARVVVEGKRGLRLRRTMAERVLQPSRAAALAYRLRGEIAELEMAKRQVKHFEEHIELVKKALAAEQKR